MIKSFIRQVLLNLGYSIHEAAWIEQLKRGQCPHVPPGHFYSPHPDLEEVRTREGSIFSHEKAVLGIDLRVEEQFEMLSKIAQIYPSLRFPESKTPEFRYFFDNPFYTYSDGIVLHAMLRIIKPHRLIEVGAGFSSAMTLDTNELYFQNALDVTFIEPHPEILYSLMKPTDKDRITIIASQLQDLDPSFFEKLEDNDILFIDSTHVSKVNSDVNFVFFEVMPRLKRGVHIHFHDIFYPFEYIKEWIYKGWTWQEIYLLRAFLQDNPSYHIKYFQDFMFTKYRVYFEQYLPLCLKNSGASLWLQKVA